MKTTFQVEIDPVIKTIFFPKFRIKDKLQIIEILLESARYILHSKKEKLIRSNSKIIFYREKMSRIFFVDENKMYSIIFPFDISNKGDEFTLTYKNLISIDSLSISNLLILLKNPLFKSESCLDFVEPILELGDKDAILYWPLFKDLLMLEDGYLRYDIDEITYQEAKLKKQEHHHPLHHLDIFYTNAATFKMGLEKAILDTDFLDTVNVNSNCYYLSKAK